MLRSGQPSLPLRFLDNIQNWADRWCLKISAPSPVSYIFWTVSLGTTQFAVPQFLRYPMLVTYTLLKSNRLLNVMFRAFIIKSPGIGYRTLVLSILHYSSEFWRPWSRKDISKLESSRNRFIKGFSLRCGIQRRSTISIYTLFLTFWINRTSLLSEKSSDRTFPPDFFRLRFRNAR